jgi:hypothetical protein
MARGSRREAHHQPKGHPMSDEIDTNSPEFKAALNEAIAEAVEGLKAKNTELLGKIKKLQQGQQIDPADLEAVERERDTLKQQLGEAQRQLKKANTDLEAATKRAGDIDAVLNRTLLDAALGEELSKVGVTNPVHAKAARALLSGSVQVVDDNGTRSVRAGDKALSDFLKEWASSDEGKHFVAAPDANGGGSHGGAPGNGNQPRRSQMNTAQKAEYIGKHGQEAYLQLPD